MIKLIDADRATRDFYYMEGIELGPRLDPPVEDHPMALERMPNKKLKRIVPRPLDVRWTSVGRPL